jgi:putative RNA 2'-phosphotransferase
LYHGTKKDFLYKILEEGLKPMNRQHVHLSPDIETATIVANRRKGDNVILEISAKAMYADKLDIYLSDNGVYLTEKVENKYIKVI